MLLLCHVYAFCLPQDIYAFGVVMYELLHGGVPGSNTDDPRLLYFTEELSAECTDLVSSTGTQSKANLIQDCFTHFFLNKIDDMDSYDDYLLSPDLSFVCLCFVVSIAADSPSTT
jgi:hypothetical protein